MQIVIELDDTFYDILCLGEKAKKTKLTDGAVDILFKAVLNGTPLPEHHGRIIDENKIEVCEWVDVLEEGCPKASTDAPTIIEADKGE